VDDPSPQLERLLDADAWLEAAEEALASVRAEGLEPSSEARDVLEHIAAGLLSEEQAIARLVQHHRR
jgi:hypothetical protein